MVKEIFKLKRCPSCYSSKIRWVIEDRIYVHENKKMRIPNVPREKCFSCWEHFFGPVSYKIINAYRNKKKIAVGE